jgi:hypothetical protein
MVEKIAWTSFCMADWELSVVGRLVLDNLDSEGTSVGHERNAFQVLTTDDGTRRIAVTTPLDACQPAQQSWIPASTV